MTVKHEYKHGFSCDLTEHNHSKRKGCCCGGHNMRNGDRVYKGKQYEKHFQRGKRLLKVKT